MQCMQKICDLGYDQIGSLSNTLVQLSCILCLLAENVVEMFFTNLNF